MKTKAQINIINIGGKDFRQNKKVIWKAKNSLLWLTLERMKKIYAFVWVFAYNMWGWGIWTQVLPRETIGLCHRITIELVVFKLCPSVLSLSTQEPDCKSTHYDRDNAIHPMTNRISKKVLSQGNLGFQKTKGLINVKKLKNIIKIAKENKTG